MKKLLFLIPLIIILIQTLAQAPQKMSFQAVIRKSNNSLVMMQPVSMRISVIQGSANGTIVYQETHSPTTNSNGLVSLEIGTGTIISGVFSNINWGTGPYFIKTETDPLCGTNYTVVGVSEFLSVPYALYALNSNNSGYLGSSKTILNLATIKPGINFLMTVSTGLAYTPLNNILVSNGMDNYLHAIVLEYNPINGLMLLKPLEIIGASAFNKWTVNLDGSKGANGIEGQQGQQGLQGLQGLNGLSGLIGPMGSQGNMGNTGLQGISGLTGLTGANGLQGPQGIQGSVGANGLNGVNGAIGPQGLIGLTGDQGLQGVNGANGLPGLQGIAGSVGANGLNGVNGAIGPIGPQGVIGNTGQQGVTGATGTDGTPGGATGPSGPTGPTGVQGEMGPIGLTGSIGTTGPAGPTGPTGGIDPSTILSPVNGGLGKANNVLSTITIAGANPMTFTNTDITNVTLPISGTLYGTKTSSFSSSDLLNSLSDKTGTGTSVFAISPAFTSIPTAPTASIGTNTTQLATTEFVMQNKLPKQFSISSGTEISTTSTSDAIASNMTLTPGAGKYFVTFNSQYSIELATLSSSAADLSTIYSSLMSKANTISHLVTFSAGTYLPGVYYTNAASTAGGNIILDANNVANAEFVFKLGGAFSTNASTTISLINGASACNVYWIAEGAIALGANTSMQGTLIAHPGAITSANGSTIVGRLYSTTGAIGFDQTSLSIPTGCTTTTNYGLVNSYAAFTSNGALTNTGTTNISGNIGTNVGAITGFEAPTVITGNAYSPTTPPANSSANFSIFQNNVLIPFSSRIRINTLNLAEISLTAIATIGAGEPIDIRWRIDAGTIKLQNRILTLIEVK